MEREEVTQQSERGVRVWVVQPIHGLRSVIEIDGPCKGVIDVTSLRLPPPLIARRMISE